MRNLLALVLGIVCVLGFGTAMGATIYADYSTGSTGKIGSMEGELSYDADEAELTLTIKNTTSSEKGYITGFVFNTPDGYISNVILEEAPDDFMLIGGPDFENSISAAPFGDFDVGVSVGKNFLGGGPPGKGLGFGEEGDFVFQFEGNDLGS